MTNREIRFEVDAALYAEAEELSAELGLEIADMAANAFAGYLEGVRDGRLNDLDEQDPRYGNVSSLPGAASGGVPLEGTEPWLGTEKPV